MDTIVAATLNGEGIARRRNHMILNQKERRSVIDGTENTN